MILRSLAIANAVAVTMLVLSGCGARQLSTLQLEYHDVLEQRKQAPSCASMGGKDDPFGCFRNFEAEFASIAAEAREANSRHRSEDGIKAGLYRLEAVASWQAGLSPAEVTEVARRGRAKCDGGLKDKAPRDCALLMVIPEFLQTELATAKVRGFKADGEFCRRGDTQEETEAQKFAIGYKTEYFDPLIKDVKLATLLPGLDDSVKRYLTHQVERARDQAYTLKMATRDCLDEGSIELDAVNTCPCPQPSNLATVCPAVDAHELAKVAHTVKCKHAAAEQAVDEL